MTNKIEKNISRKLNYCFKSDSKNVITIILNTWMLEGTHLRDVSRERGMKTFPLNAPPQKKTKAYERKNYKTQTDPSPPH